MHAKISLFALGVVALAVASLYPTLQFPSSAEVSTFIGPRVWPLALLVILIALGLLLLLLTWRSRASDPATAPTDDTPRRAGFSLGRMRHWWLMLATLAYTLLMQQVGFLIASLTFTLIGTYLLGARSWVAIAITLVVAGVLMQGVFVSLLGIPMP
ncbi:tripartite tricarboxylate transporter TctB family protein [Halomonas dongshanensis]|uniref:Tripartite tricarboxylate transporter TctB family protein n=1 Tax=Halomonas dongshanensis TaxID=2890835 RepID=A0ABT2E9Y6_9GAMM|nr:tripartite tricarboxylate transporter TctB family protein [Halomonas dongshanensis]MCS2608163.1 tripartite tricarboxylate transporter TctB family protein [Halomonas dongshanensis]